MTKKDMQMKELETIRARQKDIREILNGDFKLNEDDAVELMFELRCLGNEAEDLIAEILCATDL